MGKILFVELVLVVVYNFSCVAHDLSMSHILFWNAAF